MAAKPSIEKIVFNVHGKKLELTSDEAKELKQILSDLFGETQIVNQWHTWPHPWHWPYSTWAGTIGGNQCGTLTNASSGVPVTGDTLYLQVN